MTADTPNLIETIGYYEFANRGHKCVHIAGKARTELSALKARVEAAEGLLREAREMLDNGRECDDCGPSVTDLKRRIDAALQAAMEA